MRSFTLTDMLTPLPLPENDAVTPLNSERPFFSRRWMPAAHGIGR